MENNREKHQMSTSKHGQKGVPTYMFTYKYTTHTQTCTHTGMQRKRKRESTKKIINN